MVFVVTVTVDDPVSFALSLVPVRDGLVQDVDGVFIIGHILCIVVDRQTDQLFDVFVIKIVIFGQKLRN